jgi:hypothetical protein
MDGYHEVAALFNLARSTRQLIRIGMVFQRPIIALDRFGIKRFSTTFAVALLLAVAYVTLAPRRCSAAEPSSRDLGFFEKKIRPLLVKHCYECHGGGTMVEANLRLDSREGWLHGGDTGPAIVPGEPEESLLMRAIRYGGDFEMPPKGKLPDEAIKLFEEWIARGAPAPKGTGERVTRPETIDLNAGRQFWAYRPVTNPSVPTPAKAEWSSHPIDRFVLARLEAAGMAPNSEADRVTLTRRLYFDLLGLPPTPKQIDEFLRDESPRAYERLVDRLLASSHFGERWGRHWLDIVRYGESLTLRGFVLPEAWRYRDYVIESFNEDRPYDQVLREQIAGDLLPAESLVAKQRQRIATTFLALGNTNLEEQDKRQLDMDVVDEQLDTIGKAMLGQTIGCARCHDHKFDPIPTRDYYAMAGILRSAQSLEHANVSKWIEVTLPLAPEEEQRFARLAADLAAAEQRIGDLRAEITRITDSRKGDADVHVVAQLKDLPGIVVDDEQAKRVGAWKESQHIQRYIATGYLHDDNIGKGEKTLTFVPALPASGRYEVRLAYTYGPTRAENVPVTVFGADGERTLSIDERLPPPIDGRFISLGEYNFERAGQSFVIVATEGTRGYVIADAVQFLPIGKDDNVAADVAASRSDAGKPTTASGAEDQGKLAEKQTQLRQLESELRNLRTSVDQLPKVMTVVEGTKPADVAIHIRGSVHSLSEVVPRGFLQVATNGSPPAIPGGESGRRQLAEWMASKNNPLTARVYVNRVWHWLFGQGLVRTTDNFGATGEAPSHPELLDHLASRFVNDGWSVKRLIRYVVLSKTYRLSSADNEGNMKSDPENRLLWRMNRKRLEAECIRDAMLLVSGQLDRTMGGNTIKPGTNADYGYQQSGTRRSVFLPVFRNALPELLEAFDFADPSLVVGQRNTSTVATQALFLLNEPFVREQAQGAAKRLLSESATGDEQRIDFVFRSSIGRMPTAEEREIAVRTIEVGDSTEVREAAWAELFHALFASVDFRYRG